MTPYSVIKMVQDVPHQSLEEKAKIIDAIMIADTYGYGNVISWLQTAWATKLRDDGIPEKSAIAATEMSPKPLPKRTTV